MSIKRALSLLLAVVMLFGLAGTVYAESDTPTFAVSEETAAPGETVRVTIRIQNNPKVASIQLEPQYDHNILAWTGIEQGDYADHTGIWYPRIDKGYFAWFGPGGHNVDFDGVLATLVFKVNENAPAGDTTVTVSYEEDNVFDQDEENVRFDIRDGKVTVTGQQEGPAFKTQSLLLKEQIGVRFYLDLPGIAGYAYQGVDFSISGKDGKACAATVAFSDDLPRNNMGWYGFTYYVNTIRMADTITATLRYTVNGKAKTLVKTYAVKDYFTAFDADYAAHPEAYSDDVVNLIRATADLGHYAQEYLDEVRNEWSVPTDHAEMDWAYATYTDADIAEAAKAAANHALAAEGSCTDIRKLSYMLDVEGETEIRVIVTMQAGFDGTLKATADGADCRIEKKTSGQFVVRIRNVQAHQLSRRFTIVLTTENGSVTLTCSGLSCVNRMLTTDAGTREEQNAAVAIRRFSGFADVVKGNPENARKVGGNR